MARNFEELRQAMSPERRARIRHRTSELLAELRLREVRTAFDVTQEELAARLGVDQANISRLERRRDMRLSTLAGYVQALGGQLEIRAVFPEGSVLIEAPNGD